MYIVRATDRSEQCPGDDCVQRTEICGTVCIIYTVIRELRLIAGWCTCLIISTDYILCSELNIAVCCVLLVLVLLDCGVVLRPDRLHVSRSLPLDLTFVREELSLVPSPTPSFSSLLSTKQRRKAGRGTGDEAMRS